MTGQTIIGINCSHDSSVCILNDGRLVAALCEERMTRQKHQSGFPSRTLAECLAIAGLDLSIRPASVVVNQLPPSDHMASLRRALPLVDPAVIRINPSHHLLHACYAKAASGFPEAAILVVDGSGYSYGEHRRRNSPLLDPAPADEEEWEALSMFHCDASHQMRVIDRQWGLWVDNTEGCYRFPSLGHMYSLAAQRIFGSWTHAGKVMGLAPYGDVNALPLDMIRLTSTGVEVRTDWILELLPAASVAAVEEDPASRNLAARVQAELERAMLHLVRILGERTGSRHLCLTGGVALNSVCNGRIVREGPFQDVFITPAAQDAGVAIGAAVFGYHTLTGTYPDLSKRQEFLGREYDEGRLRRVASSAVGVAAEWFSDPADRAAADLADGRFVGWFEGAGEFGPRALGHRSILADPRESDVKDRLNNRVKYREAFRPYAAAVLAEESADWFELATPSPHMLLVGDVKPSRRRLVPAVVHVDGSCRLQTVRSDHPGRLRRLIERFRDRTGVPLVLNTSLNLRGEPTCETPEDALRCFIRSGLDVLYLGNWRLVKSPHPGDAHQAAALVPMLHDEVRLSGLTLSKEGGWSGVGWSVSVGGRWEVALDESDAAVLRGVNGRKTVAALAGDSGQEALEAFERLLRLRDRGVLYFVVERGG